jgi:hypothetical protein
VDSAAGMRMVAVDTGMARTGGSRSPADALVGRGGCRHQSACGRVGSWTMTAMVWWCGLAVTVCTH